MNSSFSRINTPQLSEKIETLVHAHFYNRLSAILNFFPLRFLVLRTKFDLNEGIKHWGIGENIARTIITIHFYGGLTSHTNLTK